MDELATAIEHVKTLRMYASENMFKETRNAWLWLLRQSVKSVISKHKDDPRVYELWAFLEGSATELHEEV